MDKRQSAVAAATAIAAAAAAAGPTGRVQVAVLIEQDGQIRHQMAHDFGFLELGGLMKTVLLLPRLAAAAFHQRLAAEPGGDRAREGIQQALLDFAHQFRPFGIGFLGKAIGGHDV